MKKKLIRWPVEHPATTLIAMLGVFLFGTLSWITLPRESQPDITIPVVLVTTPWIGVSPADIEGLVSIPLENELASLRNIKELRSTSAEGVSVVAIEFEPDVVIEDALQQVRDRVNRARPDLPDDVDEPSIREISFSDIPVVLVTLAGGLDEEGLERLADRLRDDVVRTPGVLDARISGGVERMIRVQVDADRLAHYGLALHDLSGAIGDENVNIPGGNVVVGKGDVLLRVPGEFTDPQEIEEVAIKRVGDRPVFVRDVARVVDGQADRESYARMMGEPAVTLSVTKRGGANILEVASAVKATAAAHAEGWPEGVEYRILGDQSRFIDNTVNDLMNSIITALLLIVAVMIYFMGLRNSLMVAFAIPLSMLGAMMVLDLLGFTLNMIVLFSLILALALLVDNGIVVVENIYRHAELGKSRADAAVDGTAEVAMAISASTVTTVSAFFPLAMWSGIIGQFMGFLPKTVIIVLISSLCVAIFVLPLLASRMLPRNIPQRGSIDGLVGDQPLSRPLEMYRRILLASIRYRYLSAMSGVLLLLGTILVYSVFNHGTEFFPDTDPDRATVGVRLPQGSDLETTDRVVRQIERLLAAEPNIDTWVAESGVTAGGSAMAGSSNRPNEARLTLDFLPAAANARPGERHRVEATPLTIDRLRAQVATLPGAKVTIDPEGMGPPVGPPIEVQVSGDDFDVAGEIAQRLRRELGLLEGVVDLSDDYRVGRPELALRIDRGAATRVGVSTAAIGNTVRTAVAGAVASTLRDGDDEVDIQVELAPEYRENLQSVLDLRLPGREDTSPSTFPVPLASVATYALQGGSGTIQHIDQDLVVTLTGDVRDGYNANEVRQNIQRILDDWERPAGYNLTLTGAQQDQEEAAAFLGRAFLIAVLLMLLVLVAQFDRGTRSSESSLVSAVLDVLVMPAIILVTVILSFIGVLWGLMLTGTPFGVLMTGIGIISLAAVVVNNAIVLLDYVQQLEARGLDAHSALVEAGITRFRPVMLTATTTILGLLPMAFGISVDYAGLKIHFGTTNAQWWGPMAVAVIFGLGVATVLTLVMVPTLYSIYEDFRTFRGRIPALLGMKHAALLPLALLPWSAEATTLQEAWEAASQHDIALQIAREQAIQASTLRGQAWSTVSPRVETSATYVLNSHEILLDFSETIPPQFAEFIDTDDLEPTLIQRRNFWQADLAVSQRLFSGTALPLLQGANALHKAGWLQAERAAQETRARVSQVYWQLWTAQEAEAVASAARQTAGKQLELAERQVQAGAAPARARIQAELGVARAQREVEAARENRVAAQQGFAQLTGLQDAVLQAPPDFEIPASLDQALGQIDQRSDLAAAELHTQAAQAEIRANTLGWLPVIDGRFAVNYNQNTGFSDQFVMWQASARASWTLWDGGMRIAQRRELASRVRVSELQRRHQRTEAERQVRVAWESYQRAAAAVHSVEWELDLARENVRLAQAGFEAGGATWLEVEEAELALRGAALSLLRETMTRELAAVELLASAGIL